MSVPRRVLSDSPAPVRRRNPGAATALADTAWREARAAAPEVAAAAAQFFPKYFKTHRRSLPWRKTRSAFRLLLAEMMLQKTHSRAVGAVWKVVVTKWPSPKLLAKADGAELRRIMAPLGIHYRADRLKTLAQELTDRFSESVPSNYEELRSLTGVGDYTASSVLCQAFGRRQPMIDVNAGRVYSRLYGQRFRTERQSLQFARAAAEAVIASSPPRETNLAILDFAQAVCTPVPRCSVCELRSICRYARSLEQATIAAPSGLEGPYLMSNAAEEISQH